MTSEERRDFISLNTGDEVSAKKRRKQTKSERKKLARRSKKLRRIRKFRSKVKRAKGPGQKATIMLPGGKKKKIRKKFYITTWDSKGNSTGTLWYTAAKPDKESIDDYFKQYGVKHPMTLSVRNVRR